MLFFVAVKSFIGFNRQMILERVSQSVLYTLREDIYARIEAQSFAFFDRNKVGDLMSRMTGDLEAVRHGIAFVVYQLFFNVTTFLIAFVLIFNINWMFGLTLLTVSPVIAFLAVKQGQTVRPLFSKIRERYATLNTVCEENISGNRLVKAFTREDYEMGKFTAENTGYYDANLGVAAVTAKYMPVQDFFANLMTFIFILAGGMMVIYEKMALYQLIMISGYLWWANTPMQMLGPLINDFQRLVASLDKIYDLMRTDIGVENAENPIIPEKISGRVEFRDVSFSYDRYNKRNMVLKNISFIAEPGQTVGIVGPTGSGKSALAGLIGRFYDVTGGNVLIDGADVREIDLQTLRGSVLSSMQDVFLFSDTVEGNVSYGAPDADMETVCESARVAQADGFIRKLEDGYDTIVGERGVGLSGGQKQRISLARAIAPGPAVLILDDTTSAVDMETEHMIQEALDEKYSHITKFIIAHRISSVRGADIILVIADGTVIERGTHEELIENGGYYYELFIGQYGDYEEYMSKTLFHTD